MQCPICHKTDMCFEFGPDGSYEGVYCNHCRRSWYSDSITDKAGTVISHALQAFIATQNFPEDAVENIGYPRDRQLDFDDHYYAVGHEGSFVFHYEPEPKDEDAIN